MPVQIKTYAKFDFIRNAGFTDSNVEEFSNHYFICVNASGWIHSKLHFKEKHYNVINLTFDDVVKSGPKWIHEYVPISYNAIAMTAEQAHELINFINNISTDSVVHIYCAKGKSRSPAIAKFIEEYKNNDYSNIRHGHNSYVYNLLREAANV